MRKKGLKKAAAFCLTAVIATTNLFTEQMGTVTNTVYAKAKQTCEVNEFGILISYTGSSNVKLTSSVTGIKANAFDGIKTTSFSVPENSNFMVQDGVLYSKDGKVLLRCATEKSGAFTVPDSVVRINAHAFKGCHKLTSVTMGNQVKGIGNSVFEGCSSVKEIALSSNVTKLRENVFKNCRSLEKISNLSSKISKIPVCGFANCKSLKELRLPYSVRKIENSAFFGCSALESISISPKTTSIYWGAFEKCTSLKSVNLPNNVDYMGASCFEGCTSLVDVKLSRNLSEIENSVFKNCSNLQRITLYNGIDYIGIYAFSGCQSLTELTIPNSVSTINKYVFRNCKNLNLTLGKNISDIQNCAFDNGIRSFSVDEGNRNFTAKNGVLYSKDMTKLIKYPCYKSGDYSTPRQTIVISEQAFTYSNKIDSVEFGEGITTIDKRAFENSLVSRIEFPSSLRKVRNASGQVNTPALKTIKIDADNTYFSEVEGILYNADKSGIVFYPTAKTGTVNIVAETKNIDAISEDNHASAFCLVKTTTGESVYAVDDGMITNPQRSRILVVANKADSYTLGKKMRDISALRESKPYMTNFVSYKVNKRNRIYSVQSGVLFKNSGRKLVDYPAAKRGAYTVPAKVTGISPTAFCETAAMTGLTISKKVNTGFLDLVNCGALNDITVKEGDLRSLRLYIDGTTSINTLQLPTSLVNAKMFVRNDQCDHLTVKGYTNTCAEKLAKKVGAQFVSLGIVPKPIKNLKVKAYVTGNRVIVSWNMDSQVDGYEIYSDGKKWKVITDNRITSTTLYVGTGFRDIYIRSYINQNGKKIYGKAKKVRYYNY